MLTRYRPDAKGRAVRKALVYTKNEHGIHKDQIDPEAVRIIAHLRNNGYDGYLVGGAVRDLLIGKIPKDFDIVTNAEPARIKRIFRNSRIIGKRFRLVHIFFGSNIFEVSTFRSLEEGTTGNSFGTMDEDVQRRDFTMNALYYDPIKEQLVDYVGGVRDIRAKKLKEVIPLKTIFIDDPVRMIRAIKYAVSTGCTIPFRLGRRIRKSSALLLPVSPSRLTEELIKILNSGRSQHIVQEALKYDLYMYLQPAACSLFDDSPSYAHSYSESLSELDRLIGTGEDVRLGRKLVPLIKDLLQRITDWNGNPADVYHHVYHECRRFIMPMNPPRIELEYAVRYCLKEGGLSIRIPRQRERDNKRKEGDVKQAPGENQSAPRKRRRNRRKPVTTISASQ